MGIWYYEILAHFWFSEVFRCLFEKVYDDVTSANHSKNIVLEFFIGVWLQGSKKILWMCFFFNVLENHSLNFNKNDPKTHKLHIGGSLFVREVPRVSMLCASIAVLKCSAIEFVNMKFKNNCVYLFSQLQWLVCCTYNLRLPTLYFISILDTVCFIFVHVQGHIQCLHMYKDGSMFSKQKGMCCRWQCSEKSIDMQDYAQMTACLCIYQGI